MRQFRKLREFRCLMLALLSWVALINATNVAAQATPEPTAKVVSTIATTTPPAPPSADQPAQAEKEKPVEKPKNIALILPLASKSLGKAAESVRAGFVAAAAVNGRDKFTHQIYLAEDEGASLAALYRKAAKEGAVAVVAGLTRDGAAVVANESGYLPTLALNTPADLALAEVGNFFHISLAIDHDARQIARAAFRENFRSVVVIANNAALPKRIQDAFEKEWTRLGGAVVARIVFSGELADGPKVKTAMEKPDAAKADVAFIAADLAAARIARPYLPQGLAVFATAQSFDPRAGAVENLDMDSVKYLEMPWFAERDHAAVMSYPRSAEGTPVDYERLYALGIDAWRVMLALLQDSAEKTTDITTGNTGNAGIRIERSKRSFAPIDGVTGRISLDGNQFVRSLPLLEMRDGRPQLVKAAE